MVNRGFSIVEATDFLQRYEHLAKNIACSFEKDEIACVAVSPFDKLNKLLFLEIYQELKCPVKALKFYKGDIYDVVIIFKSIKTGGHLYHIDMASFLLAHQVSIEHHSNLDRMAAQHDFVG